MAMAQRKDQDDQNHYEDDYFDEDGTVEHQLGGLSLQELQQREMAHRRDA